MGLSGPYEDGKGGGAIMKEQVADGVVQKVETELNIEVTYLPHCAMLSLR